VSIKQREELLQSLAVQNEELNEYAHVVSHDLKPLRNIDTLVNWVIEDNKEHMAVGCLQSLNLILFNVEKMDLLIKGILEYSTIGKADEANRLVDFDFDRRNSKNYFYTQNIQISILTDLPKIYGNSFRFKQVLQNLIQNSITIVTRKRAL
jgi:light-regulated signal transduction histidine kinase (bacteriophytochrome)